MLYTSSWECRQMSNFRGNEDLCKLVKEYLNDLLCKLGPFCLQHSKTFGISQAFLRVTIIIIIMTHRQLRFVAANPHMSTFICTLPHLSPAGRCFVADLLYPGFLRMPTRFSRVHPPTLLAFHCNDAWCAGVVASSLTM